MKFYLTVWLFCTGKLLQNLGVNLQRTSCCTNAICRDAQGAGTALCKSAFCSSLSGRLRGGTAARDLLCSWHGPASGLKRAAATYTFWLWAVVSPSLKPLQLLVAAEKRGLDLGLSSRGEDGSWWILAGPSGSSSTTRHHYGPMCVLVGREGPWCDCGPRLAADPWRNSVIGMTRDLGQRRKIHVSP